LFLFLAAVNSVAMSFMDPFWVNTRFHKCILRSWIAGHMVIVLNCLRNCQTFYQSGCTHFTFPPATSESFNFSTALPTLVIVCLFNYIHHIAFEVISYYGLDLHFTQLTVISIFSYAY
jgi:hypothetical protein